MALGDRERSLSQSLPKSVHFFPWALHVLTDGSSTAAASISRTSKQPRDPDATGYYKASSGLARQLYPWNGGESHLFNKQEPPTQRRVSSETRPRQRCRHGCDHAALRFLGEQGSLSLRLSVYRLFLTFSPSMCGIVSKSFASLPVWTTGRDSESGYRRAGHTYIWNK